jgi:hypothetical protein
MRHRSRNEASASAALHASESRISAVLTRCICSAAVPAAVAGTSRPRVRRQDAFATAGKMPALRGGEASPSVEASIILFVKTMSMGEFGMIADRDQTSASSSSSSCLLYRSL